MKKLLYLSSILLLITTSTVFLHGNDASSETNVSRLESDITYGDENPDLLVNATCKLSHLLADESIGANHKKIWYNWIVTKTNRMIELNRSRAAHEKFELDTLIASIEQLTPSIHRLPPTTAPVTNIKTNI